MQTNTVLENGTHKIITQTDHPIPDKRPGLELINKEKRTCHFVSFAVPADDKVKLKENEKKKTNTWISPESCKSWEKWKWQWKQL